MSQTNLRSYLGEAYAYQVLGRGTDPTSAFVVACNESPDLRDQAQAELNRLQSVNPQQCFVSGRHAAWLKSALEKVG